MGVHGAFPMVQQFPCDDALAGAAAALDELDGHLFICLGVQSQLDKPRCAAARNTQVRCQLGEMGCGCAESDARSDRETTHHALSLVMWPLCWSLFIILRLLCCRHATLRPAAPHQFQHSAGEQAPMQTDNVVHMRSIAEAEVYLFRCRSLT